MRMIRKRAEPATRPMMVARLSGEVRYEGSIAELLAVEFVGLALVA